MCCLFGLIDYGHRLSGRQRTRLLQALAAESEVRGTDAAGIAYNTAGRLRVYKRPGPAHKLDLFLPKDTHVVMGHTRMATQGSEKKNCNNHPFTGHIGPHRFALAHNGVLYNDRSLRKRLHLPSTGIETDSYIAVQLLEQSKALDFQSLKEMAEEVEGSFTFTVLDQENGLYFLKGDNPLCIRHFPALRLYLYASTKIILERAIQRSWLVWEDSTEVPLSDGDILRVDRDGDISGSRFQLRERWLGCWDAPCSHVPHVRGAERWYLQQLKQVASTFGYRPEQIDTLLREGWSTDEIEDALYCCQEL